MPIIPKQSSKKTKTKRIKKPKLLNKLLGYYKNDGLKVEDITQSDFVQIELLGSHAKSNDAVMLVSTSALSLILDFQWYLGKDGYPVAYQSVDGQVKLGRGMKIYQMIMPQVQKGNVIDHINRNKLDNRFSNLRECTSKQNSYNTSKPKNLTKSSGSKYKGVKKGAGNTWTATISKDGETNEIKNIQNEKQAAKIYDLMAEEMFGIYAGKNFN